jgi:hypothetical protein
MSLRGLSSRINRRLKSAVPEHTFGIPVSAYADCGPTLAAEETSGAQYPATTKRYERKMYLIQDTPSNRRYIGKYIEVFQFPDGFIEIRAAGVSLPYSTYDKVGTMATSLTTVV